MWGVYLFLGGYWGGDELQGVPFIPFHVFTLIQVTNRTPFSLLPVSDYLLAYYGSPFLLPRSLHPHPRSSPAAYLNVTSSSTSVGCCALSTLQKLFELLVGAGDI